MDPLCKDCVLIDYCGKDIDNMFAYEWAVSYVSESIITGG